MEYKQKTIYLLRHAKAEDIASNDFSRALTSEGTRQAKVMGRKMHQMAINPDLVFTSSAKRALETATLVSNELASAPNTMHTLDSLYLADTNDYLDLLRTISQTTDSVMVVGHNPGLENLVHLLARVAPQSNIKNIALRPATLFCLSFQTCWEQLTPHLCDIQFHIDGKQL